MTEWRAHEPAEHSIGEHMTKAERDKVSINQALHLIKIHITAEDTPQNRDLHHAVQLVVNVCRSNGILEVK
jgi:hypothetical protein